MATENDANAVQRDTEVKDHIADHIGDLYETQASQTSQLAQINAQLRQLLEDGQANSGSGVSSAITSIFTNQSASLSTPAIVFEAQNNVRHYVRLVRDWVLKVKPWTPAIRYQTLPDERWDMTLTSARVYSNREDFIAVLASAGLDTVEQELEQQLLVLPPPQVLQALKYQAGYVSRSHRRYT